MTTSNFNKTHPDTPEGYSWLNNFTNQSYQDWLKVTNYSSSDIVVGKHAYNVTGNPINGFPVFVKTSELEKRIDK